MFKKSETRKLSPTLGERKQLEEALHLETKKRHFWNFQVSVLFGQLSCVSVCKIHSMLK